jgi:hypothetical protein
MVVVEVVMVMVVGVVMVLLVVMVVGVVLAMVVVVVVVVVVLIFFCGGRLTVWNIQRGKRRPQAACPADGLSLKWPFMGWPACRA